MTEIKPEPAFVVFRAKPEQFVQILENHPESPLRFIPVVHREHFGNETDMTPLVMTVGGELLALGGVSNHEDRGEVWIWIMYKQRAKSFLRPFLESTRRALISLRESLDRPLRCICVEGGPKKNLKFAKAVGFVETGRVVEAGPEKLPCLELEIS